MKNNQLMYIVGAIECISKLTNTHLPAVVDSLIGEVLSEEEASEVKACCGPCEVDEEVLRNEQWGLVELISKVEQWGRDKGITGIGGKGTIEGQVKKFAEEANELLLGVGGDITIGHMMAEAHDDVNPEYFMVASDQTKDAIGDTLVTLILLCDLYGITLEECLQQAYDVISKRTGKMVDGQFVKDA